MPSIIVPSGRVHVIGVSRRQALCIGGSGLIGLTDRVQALGGTISVTSPPEQGTTLLVELPIAGR